MSETFQNTRRKKLSLEEDDLSLEFFITKSPPKEKKTARGVKVTDVGEGANFLDVLIFAAAVCLWLNAVIQAAIHAAGVIGFTDSYMAMIRHKSLIALVAMQTSVIFIGFGAAICASFCVNYDVHAHDVTLVAKFAIGLVISNLLISISILVMSYIEHETMAQKHIIDDSRCTGDCGKGMDIVTHLFVGCTYEGIAINVSVLPVLVMVLVKAKKFVEEDHAKREQETPRPSPHWRTRLIHLKQKKPLKSASSGSVKTVETVLPEWKPIGNNVVKAAVIRVMSEDHDDVPLDGKKNPKIKIGRVEETKPSSESNSSSSSPNPKTTSSPSETEQSESAQ